MEVDHAEKKEDSGHYIHPVQNVSVPVSTSIVLDLSCSSSIHDHSSIGGSFSSNRSCWSSIRFSKVELVLVWKVLLQENLRLL